MNFGNLTRFGYACALYGVAFLAAAVYWFLQIVVALTNPNRQFDLTAFVSTGLLVFGALFLFACIDLINLIELWAHKNQL